MKKRFTAEQPIGFLREADAGVPEFARDHEPERCCSLALAARRVAFRRARDGYGFLDKSSIR
jgi:hypothetical protein